MKDWKESLQRALALFVAFAVLLLVLVILEYSFNTVTWFSVKQSIVFFLQLWLFVAIPTVLVTYLTHSKKSKNAWKLLLLLAVLSVFVPYIYCNSLAIMCGSFGSFTLEMYWTGAVILVGAMVALVYHDTKR